ncbi:iron uptake system component EfeO [Saccharopolyspora erythraea NRRL 2338]|uniref:Uncharacterized protein n=2 Tax=Saccharopolyspora erythraea TaxID=1836 RepID=A4FCD6_SACEN|nr:cupredoxin domain-containing protein [Saccharopolyspora erythraea]EQD84998.1 hypothetical protein N599_17100 [Saccharopolyspora erythraea D]PFG95475.1 iron uptake system component EfeO [Saccharopolyspora erythraea NRRL 2338]QRK92105.1 cupredoxin domain-containing protein [Saccharopolyspora erythraea]CAM01711.1 protein of unknown function DUF451 [Saccharopolyspora erythraea NRRL 2338]
MTVRARTASLLAVLLLAGCGEQPAEDTAGRITVRAGDQSCELSATTAPAGTIRFDITNTGSQVTEFYLYGEGDRVLGEVEDIAPGLTRELVVDVPRAGGYTTACKPGMQGGGIRGQFTVTG